MLHFPTSTSSEPGAKLPNDVPSLQRTWNLKGTPYNLLPRQNGSLRGSMSVSRRGRLHLCLMHRHASDSNLLWLHAYGAGSRGGGFCTSAKSETASCRERVKQAQGLMYYATLIWGGGGAIRNSMLTYLGFSSIPFPAGLDGSVLVRRDPRP